jgi:prolyl oligopeptidase
MRSHHFLFKLILSLVSITSLSCFANKHYPTPPKSNTVITMHGVTVKDQYRPFEDSKSPRVKKWLSEEAALTHAYFQKNPYYKTFQREEMNLFSTTGSKEIIAGEYTFFTEQQPGKLFPLLYVKKVSEGDASKTLIYDPNQEKSHHHLSIYGFYPSYDGHYLIFGIRNNGSDFRSFYIYNVKEKRLLPDIVKHARARAPVWLHNNQGFYYLGYPSLFQSGYNPLSPVPRGGVYYHRIGTPQTDDLTIYTPKAGYRVYPMRLSKSPYLFISVIQNSTRHNSVFYKSLDDPLGKLKPIFSGYKAEYSLLGANGTHYYFVTTLNASNRKIVGLQLNNRPIKVSTVIKASRKFPIIGSTSSGDYWLIKYYENGSSQVGLYDLRTKKMRRLSLPRYMRIKSMSIDEDKNQANVTVSNFITPQKIYAFDLSTYKRKLVNQKIIPNFNSNHYQMKLVWYRSLDGTKISMFLVSKKGIKRDGKNTVILSGYGGYGVLPNQQFLPRIIPWLKKDGIYAVANIRGGGGYGEDWHNAGRRRTKQKTFDDFASAMRYLIRKKYTTSNKLGIWGKSQGGLMVGTMITQHPRLFKAAVSVAGTFDMMRQHLFTIGPFTIDEYGTPENEKDFHTLLAYSPLHNIKKNTHYPAALIITGNHDDRVPAFHSYKFTAMLQQATSSRLPVLLRVLKNTGHSNEYRSAKLNSVVAASGLSFLAKELNLQ